MVNSNSMLLKKKEKLENTIDIIKKDKLQKINRMLKKEV